MPRISLPAPETMTPEQRRVHDKIISGKRGRIQGPLRAALHNPELAERWSALGELLRYNTTLPPRLSEIAPGIVELAEMHRRGAYAVAAECVPEMALPQHAEVEPFDARTSDTRRSVYAQSSLEGTTGSSARSASRP